MSGHRGVGASRRSFQPFDPSRQGAHCRLASTSLHSCHTPSMQLAQDKLDTIKTGSRQARHHSLQEDTQPFDLSLLCVFCVFVCVCVFWCVCVCVFVCCVCLCVLCVLCVFVCVFLCVFLCVCVFFFVVVAVSVVSDDGQRRSMCMSTKANN